MRKAQPEALKESQSYRRSNHAPSGPGAFLFSSKKSPPRPARHGLLHLEQRAPRGELLFLRLLDVILQALPARGEARAGGRGWRNNGALCR